MAIKILDDDGNELRWNNECHNYEVKQTCRFAGIENHICLRRQ